jgi:hypothetical protein
MPHHTNPPTVLSFAGCADAYLEWAFHVKFKGFSDAINRQVAILAKRRPSPVSDPPRGVRLAEVYAEQTYCVLEIEREKLLLPNSSLCEWLTQHFERLELASAVGQKPGEDKGLGASSQGWTGSPAVLLGCIDDAFPIAQPMYWHGDKYRVIRYWNQDLPEDRVKPWGWWKLGSQTTGIPGLNWGYGGEASPRKKPGETALPVPADRDDDRAYYQRVGLSALRHASTHGAHVMDLFAGPVPAGLRNFPKWGHPPDFSGEPSDACAKAPMVLVQLPKDALNDPSGRWLGRYILDGVHYILGVAEYARVKQVVINISWGPQTGPHDGSSLLEEALDDLIAQSIKKNQGLEIVMAAGNSYLTRAHGQWEVKVGGTFKWVVPPAAKRPHFLEIWWPENKALEDLSPAKALELTAPNGQTYVLAFTPGVHLLVHDGKTLGGVTVVKHRRAPSQWRWMALLCVPSSTAGMSQAHGVWRVRISGVLGAQGLGHAYVARADANGTAYQGGQDAYLWDEAYEQHARSLNGHFQGDATHSLVKREGSLNGVATGRWTKIAQACFAMPPDQKSDYSSTGPLADGASKRLVCMIADNSRFLPGIRAAGVRLGTTVRMVGTSMAAPQLGRQLANAMAKRTGPKPDEL